MKDCPVCHMPMKEVPRFGVLLDVCPRCHGVWLDGGELEKVISMTREFRSHFEHHPDYDDHYRHHHWEKHHHYDHHGHHKKHKKKWGIFEIFEDLFD